MAWTASHYLYQLSDSFSAALDIERPRHPHVRALQHNWHGSPWQFVIDGTLPTSSAESSTADPVHHPSTSTFLPAAAFPPLLNETFATTIGADPDSLADRL